MHAFSFLSLSRLFRPFRRNGLCALVFLAVVVLGLSGCGTKTIGYTPRTTQKANVARLNSVVVTAKKQIGVHYRYGGKSPKGFDCSGLIWWSYRQHGITVPRVTRDQAKAGKNVSPSAMRPGDILVFRTDSGMHTGLYTGKGKFIHAPSSGKRVREDVVNSKYWKARLRGVRRIVT